MEKSQNTKKALIVTGSSGGHIFPALSFIEALKIKNNNIKILLVLPRKSAIKTNLPEQLAVKYISVTNIGRGLSLSNLKSGFNLLKGGLESLFLVASFRPDIVVGFGSLNSVPAILWAWFFRIRTMVHEQNVLPGEANKFLFNFADKIAISFPESRNYLLGQPDDKITLTGNPLRSSLKRTGKREALDFFGFDSSKLTLLVSGGSQGSTRINKSFIEALRTIDKSKFQVIHLAGAKDFAELKEAYSAADVAVKLFSFFQEMDYAYSAADLAFTRAGAMTISELIYFSLPAVLIPYPFAHEHQSANARVLQSRGCAIVINDRDFSATQAARTIDEFASCPEKIENMRSSFKHIQNLKADRVLADEAIALAGA